jgi:hypothetical protein
MSNMSSFIIISSIKKLMFEEIKKEIDIKIRFRNQKFEVFGSFFTKVDKRI